MTYPRVVVTFNELVNDGCMNTKVSSKRGIKNSFSIQGLDEKLHHKTLGSYSKLGDGDNQRTLESTGSVHLDLSNQNQKRSFSGNGLVIDGSSYSFNGKICYPHQEESLGCSSENPYKDAEGISNHSEQHYHDEERSFTYNGQVPYDDSKYSFNEDNQKVSSGASNDDTEDEDPSYSSSDYPFLKDSLLMELGVPLTEEEKKLIGKFCGDMEDVEKESDQESALRYLEQITEKYLERGIRLNACYGDRGQTVTNLVFEEMIDITNNKGLCPSSKAHQFRGQDVSYVDREVLSDSSENSMRNIISNLLLKGGKVEKGLFDGGELGHVTCDSDFVSNLFKQCEEVKKDLKDIARESIVNKSERKYDFKVEVDNGYFYVKYPQDITIEPAKILNNEKAKGFDLKVSILQIGESVVRVEKDEAGKRNYTDILQGGIEMSFTTEVGKISIYLYPGEGNKKIEVKIDDENKAKFNKLKDKSSLGKHCLLEGDSVSEVIGKSIERSDSVEPTETTKDVSSVLMQIDVSQEARYRG